MPRRILPVVPLISDQRNYGEYPASIRRGNGQATPGLWWQLHIGGRGQPWRHNQRLRLRPRQKRPVRATALCARGSWSDLGRAGGHKGPGRPRSRALRTPGGVVRKEPKMRPGTARLGSHSANLKRRPASCQWGLYPSIAGTHLWKVGPSGCARSRFGRSQAAARLRAASPLPRRTVRR